MRLLSSLACFLAILASPARADFSPAAHCADVIANVGTPAMAELTTYIVDQLQQMRATMPLNGTGPSPPPDPSYTGFIRRVIAACSEAPTMRVQDVVGIEYINAVLVGQPYVGG